LDGKIVISRSTDLPNAIWAHEVFVGTSGYTGKATPALQKKLIPIGSFIITTEVLPEKLALELSPRNRMIYDSKNYLYYYCEHTCRGDHRALRS
jgi:glycine/D-amino acid oxidase-like deaminating enzyme